MKSNTMEDCKNVFETAINQFNEYKKFRQEYELQYSQEEWTDLELIFSEFTTLLDSHSNVLSNGTPNQIINLKMIQKLEDKLNNWFVDFNTILVSLKQALESSKRECYSIEQTLKILKPTPTNLRIIDLRSNKPRRCVNRVNKYLNELEGLNNLATTLSIMLQIVRFNNN
jgi:hypothetical protein